MICDDDWPHSVVIIKQTGTNLYAETSSSERRRVRAFIDPPIDLVNRNVTERTESKGTTVIVKDTLIRAQDQIELPDGDTRLVHSVSTYDFDDDLLHSIVVIL